MNNSHLFHLTIEKLDKFNFHPIFFTLLSLISNSLARFEHVFFKKIHQKWKCYREEKEDFERFLIFLNIKTSEKSKKNWTQWRVYSYVERRTEPLGCHIFFVSRKKWKRQQLEKIEILDWDTRLILNFSYVFELALKLLWLADTQRCCSRLCNEVVCPLGGRHFFKKVALSSEKLAVLVKLLKILIKEFNLVRFQTCSLQLYQKQEVDDDLSVCVMNILPKVSSLPSLLAINLMKMEI